MSAVILTVHNVYIEVTNDVMLPRVLEPEVMDSPAEAWEYDQMDHEVVNRLFVDDLLAAMNSQTGWTGDGELEFLDLGTGTAQIPIELCRRASGARVFALDAAVSMLEVARHNVLAAGLAGRITLEHGDAKRLAAEARRWQVVMSNSIVHHIPNPAEVLNEAVRVTAVGGLLFFRDLLRPDEQDNLTRLVDTYAAGATATQRRMFADSLRAALTLEEIRDLVAELGFSRDTAQQTSDRHWTWAATKPTAP